MSQLNKVCIIRGKRIPFARSGTTYMGSSNKEMMSHCLTGLVEDLELKGKEVGEVVLGAVLKHAADFNLARECALESGLSSKTPAFDVQKACGTSLEAVVSIANKIALGQIDCGIAGGVDTNSDVPIEFKKSFSDRLLKINYARNMSDKILALKGLNPKEFLPHFPAVIEPRTGLSMGESCELMVKRWKVGRSEQDQLAYESHQKATSAYESGFYEDMILPFRGIAKDNNVRPTTTLEKMGSLSTAFDRSENGTLTAGNSSPLTDGASAVFICSEDYAKENDLEIAATFKIAQSAAVDFVSNEGLLMAPAYAMPKMLKKAELRLSDFDFYEIHEAFAGQVLCTLKAWEDEQYCRENLNWDGALGTIDRQKLNVKGGSVALGHPFAATGSRIVATLAKTLKENGEGKGLISVCTAGGMGVTAILESY